MTQYKSEEGLIQLLNSCGVEYDPDAEEPESTASSFENNQSGTPAAIVFSDQEDVLETPQPANPQEEAGILTGTETVGVRKP